MDPYLNIVLGLRFAAATVFYSPFIRLQLLASNYLPANIVRSSICDYIAAHFTLRSCNWRKIKFTTLAKVHTS